ncbi:hypothetical protein MM236_19200 [Belliella sp. DSM 107340]|uniref:Uncharacterized protein n=1 Tax=Belliella calami TaxID=2923436 RepID=A0ABS9UU46_9BACT|nr:hypothetical protein [Belliella calami]MCH7400131.1 hypothetical protein [Belliella calami]
MALEYKVRKVSALPAAGSLLPNAVYIVPVGSSSVEMYITSNGSPVTARKVSDPSSTGLTQEIIDVAVPLIDTDYVVKTISSNENFIARVDAMKTNTSLSVNMRVSDCSLSIENGNLSVFAPGSGANLTLLWDGQSKQLKIRRIGASVSTTIRVVLTKYINL